jgi:hypothetical protein
MNRNINSTISRLKKQYNVISHKPFDFIDSRPFITEIKEYLDLNNMKEKITNLSFDNVN